MLLDHVLLKLLASVKEVVVCFVLGTESAEYVVVRHVLTVVSPPLMHYGFFAESHALVSTNLTADPTVWQEFLLRPWHQDILHFFSSVVFQTEMFDDIFEAVVKVPLSWNTESAAEGEVEMMILDMILERVT